MEVHAREVARNLQNQSIRAELSQSLASLSESWDVIHTHGSSILPPSAYGKANTTYVHTLHGTTWGRMWACREFFWVGGYLAQWREILAVLRSDVVLAVHENLWLFRAARWLGKRTAVCGNGWDAGGQNLRSPLPAALQCLVVESSPFWVFIGRGSDPVKGAERIKKALPHLPENFRLLAAPGEGFSQSDRCYPTGPLNALQVRELLHHAQGLILCSSYEGLPLVVLEALAHGVPVVSTEVGGLKSLFTQSRLGQLVGLHRLAGTHPLQIARTIQQAMAKPQDRGLASKKNQIALQTWEKVTGRVVASVKK